MEDILLWTITVLAFLILVVVGLVASIVRSIKRQIGFGASVDIKDIPKVLEQIHSKVTAKQASKKSKRSDAGPEPGLLEALSELDQSHGQ